MRCLLIIIVSFNVMFLLICLGTLLGGMYLILGFEHMNKNILPTFDDAKRNLESLIKAINVYPGVRNPNPPNVTNSNPLKDIHFDEFVRLFGYFTVGYSVVVATLAILSMIGTYRRANHVITLILVSTILLLVFEFVWFLLFIKYPAVIERLIGKFFKDDINYEYKAVQSRDSFMIGWNLLMKKFKCCGVQSYLDFNASFSFSDMWGEPQHSFSTKFLYETAIACCDKIEVNLTIDPKFQNPCHRSVYIEKKGCIHLLFDLIDEYKNLVMTVFSILFISQIIYAVLNVFLRISKHGSDKIVPTSTDSSIHGKSNINSNQNPNSKLETKERKPAMNQQINNVNTDPPYPDGALEPWYSGERLKPMGRPERLYF